MLVWLTQLGLSVACPLAGFVLLSLWVKNALDLGSWVIWLGLALGLWSAAAGFRNSLKLMDRTAGGKKKDTPPPVSFNEHT